MSLSEGTKRVYNNCLKKLTDLKITINPLISVDYVINKLVVTGLKQNTIKSYLNAILWYSKENKINDNHIEDLQKNIKTICKSVNAELKHNLPNEKEKDRLIKWETVLEIHKKLERVCTTNESDFLTLSLYVYMPPRRILDFVELYHDDDQEINQNKVIKYGSKYTDVPVQRPAIISSDNKNYYAKKGDIGYFIFNNYKTKYTYSTQYLELNPQLTMLLDKYITNNNIKKGDKIIGITHDGFIKRLQRIFMCYENKSISASCLRHIYINYMRENNKLTSILIKEQLAYQMGHSIGTQEEYYKDMSIL